MTMRLLRVSNLKQQFCVKFRKLFNPETLEINKLKKCKKRGGWVLITTDTMLA